MLSASDISTGRSTRRSVSIRGGLAKNRRTGSVWCDIVTGIGVNRSLLSMFRSRQIVPLAIAVAVFFLLSDASGQRKNKQKPVKKTPLELEALYDSAKLTVVECKLPMIDSADDRPTFSLDGRMMVFGSHRPPTADEP